LGYSESGICKVHRVNDSRMLIARQSSIAQIKTVSEGSKMGLIGRNVEVFPLALGTNIFGWTTDETAAHGVLDAFVGGGGNFIDTADSYSMWVAGHTGGEAETIIGSWLATSGRRDDVVLGTKVGQHPRYTGLAPTTVAAAAEESLRRLRTDYIDVYFAHLDDDDTPLHETVAAFDGLVKAGKVRFVGLSNYSAERIREWIRVAKAEGFDPPAVLQPVYNLVSRRLYETDLAAAAEEGNLAVMPYFGLASGFLTGKFRSLDDISGTDRAMITQGFFSDEGLDVIDVLEDLATAHSVSMAAVALGWLVSRPGVIAPIASARNEHQLGDLMEVSELVLTENDLKRLDAVSDRISR